MDVGGPGLDILISKPVFKNVIRPPVIPKPYTTYIFVQKEKN